MPRKAKKNKFEKPVTLHQWIEISTVNGQTVARFYPSNDQLEIERLEMSPQPTLIYRRLHFVNGVPASYRWVDAPPEAILHGGLFTMRIDAARWPAIFRQERLAGNDQVIKARSEPRPEAYGPCLCYRCTAARELADRLLLS